MAIEVRADDDYGVDRLELVYAVRGGPERVVPLRQGPPETSVTGARTLFVEEFEVEPGDFVTAEVTYGAPHHLIAERFLAVERTAPEAAAACTPSGSSSQGPRSVLLGIPALP